VKRRRRANRPVQRTGPHHPRDALEAVFLVDRYRAGMPSGTWPLAAPRPALITSRLPLRDLAPS